MEAAHGVCAVLAFISAREYECCGEPLRVGDVTTVLQSPYRGGHPWDDVVGPIDWTVVRHVAADRVVEERVRVWRVLEIRSRQGAAQRDEPRVVVQEAGRIAGVPVPGGVTEGWLLQLELLPTADPYVDPYSLDAVRSHRRSRAFR